METLIFFVLLVIFVIYVTLKWLEHRMVQEIIDRELVAEVERRLPVLLNIEEINGVVYGWDHKTNDFVCQGTDLEEFRTAFRARYPNRNAAVVGGPDELIQRFKTELRTILQNENLNSQ